MEQDQVLIFANPIAGRGRGRVIAAMLETELRSRGYEVRTFLSRLESAGYKPDAGRVRAAVVVGGDGTLRTVAQWAIERGEHAESRHDGWAYPLLIVPMGTANLMGQHLGIAWDPARLPQQVAEALEQRRTVHLDVARAGEGILLLVAGTGFDGQVIHELTRMRTGPIHLTDYAMPVLHTLTTYRFAEVQVTVDGTRLFGPAPGLVLVGNIPEYGTGFPILLHARPDDGMLDVCAMPCASRQQLMELFLSAAAGEHLGREGVAYAKGRSVRIESAEPLAVQVDGEAAGFTPLEIDLLPQRIPFILPRQA
jgi:diacylglycerol kinase (ATP)